MHTGTFMNRKASEMGSDEQKAKRQQEMEAFAAPLERVDFLGDSFRDRVFITILPEVINFNAHETAADIVSTAWEIAIEAERQRPTENT